MTVGKEPWLGTPVKIWKGQFKGCTGTVHGVNVTWETKNLVKDKEVVGKTVGRRKGIALNVELDVVQGMQQPNQLVDYLDVLEFHSNQPLNVALPDDSGHFYDYWSELIGVAKLLDNDIESQGLVLATPQWTCKEEAVF